MKRLLILGWLVTFSLGLKAQVESPTANLLRKLHLALQMQNGLID